jgi:Calcineurin-like phosphoesterase
MARRTTTAPAPPQLNKPPTPVKSPAFGDPKPTADPTTFVVKHPSDGPYYDVIDAFNKKHGLQATPFPAPRGGVEPTLTLEAVLGNKPAAIANIQNNKQIVFHSTGDCGSVRGPQTQNLVVDKMLADFKDTKNSEIPQFHFLLGDVVYSFGEVKYYYDQFYEPYREYPGPILAAAGNHDGMAAPDTHEASLDGFHRNFCAQDFEVMPEAGALSRTAQIQPGVFFTFEAPFVTIIVLYSNALEDPGVIADPQIGDSQLAFLRAALTRLKQEAYPGAILLAHHHPPYTLARHGWSIDMQTQIDAVCDEVGLWPHADLSGHAHNYQRFTRHRSDGTQIPYVICGNGGHNVERLSKTNGAVIRAPQVIQEASQDTRLASPLRDQVVFENYDDGGYGYLRIIVDQDQLRIEYPSASDGELAKAPDDSVTIDLKTRQTASYAASNLGRPQDARDVANLASRAEPAGEPADKPRSGPTTATVLKKPAAKAQKAQKRSTTQKKTPRKKR